jgi:patatin-related protein
LRISASAPLPTDQREIRLALVLNGGVSLAIWIGGVVAEIDRARRADRSGTGADKLVDVYKLLLDATGSVLRTDVLAGASAGGLNGCLLSAAMANGGNVSDLRDVWIDIGSFRSLLRSGLDPAPVSVLKGDDYFLPEVEREFRRRCDWERVKRELNGKSISAAAAERVRLFVTGTDLIGEPVKYLDDFGSTLSQREHRGLFVLEHDPECRRSSFADEHVAKRLARIARSTASFPGAFEASFCRVGAGEAHDPNLDGVASFTSSRWVIDGGVLDNAPFGAALGAIARAPASGPVRRILCYVTPYGGSEESQTAFRESAPSLSEVVGAALNLPRDVAMIAMLDDVEEYRRRTQRRRSTRRALAFHLPRLSEDAGALLPLYCRTRALASVDDLLDDITSPPHARFMREAARSASRPRVRSAQLLPPEAKLPWVPHADRADDPSLFDAEGDEWPWGIGPIKRTAAMGMDLLARTLAITPAADDHDSVALRERVHAARANLSSTIVWVAERREEIAEDARRTQGAVDLDKLKAELKRLGWQSLEDRLEGLEKEAQAQLAALLYAAERFPEIAPPSACRAKMKDVVGALEDGGSAALELLRADGLAPQSRKRLCEELENLLGGRDEPVGIAEQARQVISDLLAALPPGIVPPELRELVAKLDGDGEQPDLFARLLELEVVSETLAPSGHEHDQSLELLRINAEAPCALDGRSLPYEKLTGLGLAHFAAFYKRSWRANDWLWGRLDGAARLVDVLVDPQAVRLRIEAAGVDDVLKKLLEVACGDERDAAFLKARFTARCTMSLEDGMREELEKLERWSLEEEPPTQLPRCRDAVRARLQLEIARQELPIVARAAMNDISEEHAAPDAYGGRWARNREGHFDEPGDVVDSLTQLRIAETESFVGEIGSDLLTRNVATTATVAASALAAKRSGLPRAIRSVPLALRGTLLGLYGMTWSITSPRRALKMLALVGLLLALLVVVWGAVADADVPNGQGSESDAEQQQASDGPPAWLSALAKVVVAGGILLGVLRGGAAGIGAGAALLVAYSSIRYSDRWPENLRDLPEDVFRAEPVAMAAAAIVIAGLLTGFVAGRGPLSRVFLSSEPAKRAAAGAGIRVALLLLYALGIAAVVDVAWDVVEEPSWAWPSAAAVGACLGLVVGVTRWWMRRTGTDALRRVLVLGGEQPLAPVLRNLLGDEVAVGHRGAPRKDAELPAEGDIADRDDQASRIVLVRPHKKVDTAYRKKLDNRLLVVGGVRWRPRWYLSTLRRLLLGPADDGFAAASKLSRTKT